MASRNRTISPRPKLGGAARAASSTKAPSTSAASRSATASPTPAAATSPAPGHRLARVCAIALLVLPPLLVLPGLREPYRLPKLAASEVLALLALTVLSLALFRLRRIDLREVARLPAILAVTPLAVVVALSALVSDHPEHAVAASWSFAIGALALVGFALGLPRLRTVLDWLWWPATLLAGVAVAQRLGIANPLPASFDESRYAAASLAGNIGDLGAYLVLPLLLAQARFLSMARDARAVAPAAEPSAGASSATGPSPAAPAKRRAFPFPHLGWREAAWLAGALIWLGALALVQVLTAVAAFAVASAVFWLLAVDGRRRWAVVGGALVVALLASVLTPLGGRVASEWRELRRGDLNDVLTGRLDGWRTGLRIGSEHPVLGAGPGAYAAEFAPAKLALLEEGVPFYRRHGTLAAFRDAHSEPIEVFAELGVLGLLAAAWLVFWLVRGALALREREERPLGLAVLAAVFVLGLGHFPLRGALVGYPYVVAGAWLLASAPSLRRAGTVAPEAPAAVEPRTAAVPTGAARPKVRS